MWTISRIIISGSVYHYSLTSSFPRNSRSFEATRRRLQALTDVYQPADNYFSCAFLLIILRCVHKACADGTAAKDSKTAGISCASLNESARLRDLFTRIRDAKTKKKKENDFHDLWKTRCKCFISFSSFFLIIHKNILRESSNRSIFHNRRHEVLKFLSFYPLLYLFEFITRFHPPQNHQSPRISLSL